MTGQYTFVAPERQNELTRRIQGKLSEAARKIEQNAMGAVPSKPTLPETPPGLSTTVLATTLVQ
jgi:hypothetical protein